MSLAVTPLWAPLADGVGVKVARLVSTPVDIVKVCFEVPVCPWSRAGVACCCGCVLPGLVLIECMLIFMSPGAHVHVPSDGLRVIDWWAQLIAARGFRQYRSAAVV